MIEILIKRLTKTALIPKYETAGSSGMDLAADVDDKIDIKPGETQIVPTGLAVSIPQDFEIQIRPRSGLAAKNQISVLNTPGTIDADYRGEVKVLLINHGDVPFKISRGERIAQMIIAPITQPEFISVNELTETARGEGGFGSTGTQ